MLDILNKINQPEDLRNIEINDLEKLSDEIREVLLQKLSKNGGHFGPNFGMVEAIILIELFQDIQIQMKVNTTSSMLGIHQHQ